MRLGKVIGQVTLARCHESIRASQWKIVVPLSETDLWEGNQPSAEEVIVYDELSVGNHEIVAFSEGVEAAMPFYPNVKPIDAYCAAIIDSISNGKT
ncbi:MAG: EutN/CcmL family microcompartment protein [Thermoguttaceae bacterium]